MTVQLEEELEDRLTDLFDRAAGGVTVDERLHRVLDAAPERRRRSWVPAVAAAVVVLVGAVAVVAVSRDGDDAVRSVSQQPVDPPGPLYVLPEGLEGWEASNGSASSREVPPYSGIVVGMDIGEMFLDPVAVRVGTEPPEGFSPDTWSEYSIGGGPAFISPREGGSLFTIVTQQRGELWLTSADDDRVISSIKRAFEDLEIQPDGSLALRPDSMVALIESYDSPTSYEGHSTYYELPSASSEHVVVETANVVTPLLSLTSGSADDLQPVTVNGDAAWHASRSDADGEWNAIVWMHSPNTAVFVSGHVGVETLMDVAESLVVVDEETWVAETGCDDCD